MARYSTSQGKYVRGRDVTPVPSAARTASGDSGWLSCEDLNALVLTLAITVDNFTTLDVVVQTADDASGTNARAADGSPFAQQSGVQAGLRKVFYGLDSFYRVSWTLVGTGGTWSVTGFGK